MALLRQRWDFIANASLIFIRGFDTQQARVWAPWENADSVKILERTPPYIEQKQNLYGDFAFFLGGDPVPFGPGLPNTIVANTEEEIAFVFRGMAPTRLVLYVPLKIEKGPAGLLAVLLKEQQSWVHAIEFQHAFPDLSQLTEGLSSIGLEECKNYLEQRRKLDTTKFEVVGVSIPGRAITSWGIMGLLIVQIYFFTALRIFESSLCEFDLQISCAR